MPQPTFTIESEQDHPADRYAVRLRLRDGQIVQGTLSTTAHGVGRIADIFTGSGPRYLILNDCNGDMYGRHRTLFINTAHILWAEPV